ncbi:hypothetical protein E2C01_030208 [Portunus trituberculatus]|uniref:Uncharacterized protein n=1 Tax=Portunus trituberculatus TaxID=210409 RepID=A0A5B7EPV1_PORTR|nr:hypothetical protein [Portunus trituberculatus]
MRRGTHPAQGRPRIWWLTAEWRRTSAVSEASLEDAACMECWWNGGLEAPSRVSSPTGHSFCLNLWLGATEFLFLLSSAYLGMTEGRSMVEEGKEQE